jgi:hypothetical protein
MQTGRRLRTRKRRRLRASKRRRTVNHPKKNLE